MPRARKPTWDEEDEVPEAQLEDVIASLQAFSLEDRVKIVQALAERLEEDAETDGDAADQGVGGVPDVPEDGGGAGEAGAVSLPPGLPQLSGGKDSLPN
jgi:hypothetical protein